jgi:hypothetical protein
LWEQVAARVQERRRLRGQDGRDDNERIDLGFLGVPKEGLGVSRDARGTFGPPSFDAAKLALTAGEKRTVSIRVVYYQARGCGTGPRRQADLG